MRLRAFEICLLVLLISLPAVPVRAESAAAAEIPARFSSGDGVLAVEADEPFSRLYIEWNKNPDSGFLHEYIAVEASFFVEIPNRSGAAPNKLHAFGPGDLPEWVQQWQPPLEDADLLLLPTHADDEHLFFGGAMPLYAGERGMAVQVAYLTHHWGEPYRPHELLNGLWAVGVRNYPVMSEFPDQYADNIEQARQIYSEDEWLAFQVELLRRFRPEVVVGHDLNGEYGHGAHILNALTLREAVLLAGDETQYPASAAQYGAWTPGKLYLHLYPENAIVMDWNVPLASFGGRTALDMAKEGYAKHFSQQTYFKVEDFGPYDCRKFGLAFTSVGPDIDGNDFFENVIWPEPEPEPLPEPEPQPETQAGPAASSATESASAPAAEPEPAPEPRAAGSGWLVAAGIAGALATLLAVIIMTTKRRGEKP